MDNKINNSSLDSKPSGIDRDAILSKANELKNESGVDYNFIVSFVKDFIDDNKEDLVEYFTDCLIDGFSKFSSVNIMVFDCPIIRSFIYDLDFSGLHKQTKLHIVETEIIKYVKCMLKEAGFVVSNLYKERGKLLVTKSLFGQLVEYVFVSPIFLAVILFFMFSLAICVSILS